ncbi:MAG: superinfection immunity protein [Acidimicrobiia bacterium]
MESDGGGAAGFLFLILVGLYFIPLIVALVRKVPNVGSVGVINFFLGWTLIGWVVALAMAARSAPTPPSSYRPPPPPS